MIPDLILESLENQVLIGIGRRLSGPTHLGVRQKRSTVIAERETGSSKPNTLNTCGEKKRLGQLFNEKMSYFFFIFERPIINEARNGSNNDTNLV